jgi:GTP-binding protein HflX
VWNKIDILDDDERAAVQNISSRQAETMPVSAITGQGMDALLDLIAQSLGQDKATTTLDIPFSDGKRRAWLHAQGVIENETQTETGTVFDVCWTPKQRMQFERL